MEVSVEVLKGLREQSGAGIMACRNALVEAQGDATKALDILKQRSLGIVQKKASRAVTQGVIESYIHAGGRIGAMVEINCETDFVARTDVFRELAHNVVMQIAAMDPKFISKEEVPQTSEFEPQTVLLLQAYIKEASQTVQDIINETIAKVGENIKVSRFARFELGEWE